MIINLLAIIWRHCGCQPRGAKQFWNVIWVSLATKLLTHGSSENPLASYLCHFQAIHSSNVITSLGYISHIPSEPMGWPICSARDDNEDKDKPGEHTQPEWTDKVAIPSGRVKIRKEGMIIAVGYICCNGKDHQQSLVQHEREMQKQLMTRSFQVLQVSSQSWRRQDKFWERTFPEIAAVEPGVLTVHDAAESAVASISYKTAADGKH